MAKSQTLRQWVLSIPDEASIFAPTPIPMTNGRRTASHKRSRSVTQLPPISENQNEKRRTSFAGLDSLEQELLHGKDGVETLPIPPNGQCNGTECLDSALLYRWQPISDRCFDKRRISFANTMEVINYFQSPTPREDRRRVSFVNKPVVIQRSPSISSLAASSSSTHSAQYAYWQEKRQEAWARIADETEKESTSTDQTEIPVTSSGNSDMPPLPERSRTPFYRTPKVPLEDSHRLDDNASSVSSVSSDESWETAIEETKELGDGRGDLHNDTSQLWSGQRVGRDSQRIGEVQEHQSDEQSEPLSHALLPAASSSISESIYSYDNVTPILNYTERLRGNTDPIEYHESTYNLCQQVEPFVEPNMSQDTRHYKTLGEIVDSLGYQDQDSHGGSSISSSRECSIDQAETRAHIWPRIGVHDVKDVIAAWNSQPNGSHKDKIPSPRMLRAARGLAPTDADSIRSYGKHNRIKKRFLWFRRQPKLQKSSRDDSVLDWQQQPTLPDVAENWPLP